jgi:hypothetical protein
MLALVYIWNGKFNKVAHIHIYRALDFQLLKDHPPTWYSIPVIKGGVVCVCKYQEMLIQIVSLTGRIYLIVAR